MGRPDVRVLNDRWTVVTQDVPKDALAIGRARQVNKEGRAALVRAINQAKKKG